MLEHKVITKTTINPDNVPYVMALVETERDYVICFGYHDNGTWEHGLYYPKVACVLDAAIEDYAKAVKDKTFEIL